MNEEQLVFTLPQEPLRMLFDCSQFTVCDSLDDVPAIKMPLGNTSTVHLLLPPWDIQLLADAYRAANWRWGLTMDDIKTFWEYRQKPSDEYATVVEQMQGGVLPSTRRLSAWIQDSMSQCIQGCDWCNGGGLTVFRSKSGKIGLGVDDPVGSHYKRMKLNTGKEVKAA